MTQTLTSVEEVVSALGGTAEAARLVGRKPPAVSMWKARGRLPPSTFVAVMDILKRSGIRADPALWRMDPPEGAQ